MNFPGYYSGYITPSGTFIEVPETGEASDHLAYCDEMGVSEDYLMDVEGYVKVSHCLCREYIFHRGVWTGFKMTPEQARKLEELGYEVDEFDRP